ncbi:hypothetical protein K2Q16_00790 [Patescibacteria group bacterium]|nr:hypothetical protein [Patescibacteria group bacterium]
MAGPHPVKVMLCLEHLVAVRPLLMHWRRAGRCFELVEWEWVEGTLLQTKRLDGLMDDRAFPVGRALADRILRTELSIGHPDDYSYEVLPFISSDEMAWCRLMLLTTDLRPKVERIGRVPGVLLVQLVASPVDTAYALAGVALVGTKEQQQELRDKWLWTFHERKPWVPPDLGQMWK